MGLFLCGLLGGGFGDFYRKNEPFCFKIQTAKNVLKTTCFEGIFVAILFAKSISHNATVFEKGVSL